MNGLTRTLALLSLSEEQDLLLLAGDVTPHRLSPRLPTLIRLPVSGAGRAALLERYPAQWRAALVRGDAVTTAGLGALLDTPDSDGGFLYLPPLSWEEDRRDFRSLVEVIAQLRDPNGGCPRDLAQTHRSLAPYLLEETYETLEALDAGNIQALREELGDVLLQVVLHSQVAKDENEFTISDVVEGLVAKLVRRHPHVFGDTTAKTADEVAARWEVQKSNERGGASLLQGVPKGLPALGYAQRIQERAASVGFDWPSMDGVLDKLREEVAEMTAASSPQEREEELGDILFTLVNLGRRLEMDVEAALRQANTRFTRRFQLMEEISKGRGTSLAELPLAQQDSLWDEAKARLKAEGKDGG